MRVVIAPDSFKGTASARAVATAIADGWLSVRPDDEVRLLPMADGGEGTLEAFELAVPGSIRMPVTVRGPDDRPVEAYWLLLPESTDAPGRTAVVELANTSGITLLDRLLPLDAHTIGFGQAIAAALDHGVHRVLLAIGGSSSTDGGTGALQALGARFVDVAAHSVVPGNRGLGHLAAVDLTAMRPVPPGGALILSDVTNPLLGESGAATVFGPQKGASPAQVAALEAGLRRLTQLLPGFAEVAGSGAAGGTGFGLLHWGARIGPGAAAGSGAGAAAGSGAGSAPGAGAGAGAGAGPGSAAGSGPGAAAGAAAGSGAGSAARSGPGSVAIGTALGVADAVAAASVVITGEGRFDSQSGAGKVPGYLAGLAADSRAEALLVAGSIAAPTGGFADAVSLSDLAGSSAAAQADPLRWLQEAGALLASRAQDDGPAPRESAR